MTLGQLCGHPAEARLFELSSQGWIKTDNLHGQLAQLIVRRPPVELMGAHLVALGGSLRFSEDHGWIVVSGFDCAEMIGGQAVGACRAGGGGFCCRVCNSPVAIMLRRRS